ncbi:hypothetical protein ACEPPN_006475 [Leptodophora sp. 'Broadleaf-Isolate-01']
MSYLNNLLDQFQFFPRLPVEIRLIIWDFVINERRILQIQRHVSTADKEDHTKGWKVVSACTPSILWTNCESRNHALNSYRPLFSFETNSNLYISDRLDSLYLVTPRYEVIDDNNVDNIYDMWHAGGEMELACVYLCKYSMITSIVMDYKHLCYGEEDLDISTGHAEAWAYTIYELADLVSLIFLRNGDIELLHGQRQISQPTSIPTAFDSLLRQARSQLYKVDSSEEEEVPFPSITICDFRRIQE